VRGIYTPVTELRRRVFESVAKLAWECEEGEYASRMEAIPYEIIPGEDAQYRDSVFKERAILGERLRLAMGLSLYPVDRPSQISKDIEKTAIDEIYYEPELVNVIPFACDRCPTRTVEVTANCRGCLAHPCMQVCPKNALSFVNGKSHIDQEKCIKCGRCIDACPYHAIIEYDRPCASACGVKAIGSDEKGRAKIDYNKCVSCGLCMVNCPFGAIADKSQIFQLIHSIKGGDEVYAEIAPAFVGQFGPLASPEVIVEAIKSLGIRDVLEVAIGADLGSVEEAHHYVDRVANGKDKFLGTSCCPSWSVMAKRDFPDMADCISGELTPMVGTARIIKKEHPNAKIVFIGPCAAKKLEAMRRSVRSDVDFVITFEELMGMFAARNIEFSDFQADGKLDQATTGGRSYPVAGNVAKAIAANIAKTNPEIDVKIDNAMGLAECKKMLMLAKAGKRDGYLLEGMACPGGCIAGAGTLLPLKKAEISVNKFMKAAKEPLGMDSEYIDDLPLMKDIK
jgi:[FeFe] hydrogenase (group B1/B3)